MKNVLRVVFIALLAVPVVVGGVAALGYVGVVAGWEVISNVISDLF